jgi:hypothetical protein
VPVSTFATYQGGAGDGAGDTSAISDGAVNTYVPWLNSGLVGRTAKNTAEANLFFAFDTSAVTLGSVINGINLEATMQVDSAGSGAIRGGWLEQDDHWQNVGWNKRQPPVERYLLSYQFPNTGIALPHATRNSNTTIRLGRLVNDAWVTSDLPWTPSSRTTGERISIGTGIGGETWASLASMLTTYSDLRSGLDQGIVAFTLDSQVVGNDANSLTIVLTPDTAPSGDEPTLVIDWTENPPAFSSSPSLFAEVGFLYQYSSFALPWSLGDKTAGNFVDRAYVLLGTEGVDFPTGMTIVSDSVNGVVSWIPTRAQAGPNLVTLQVTNDAGLTDVQAFTVIVRIPTEGEISATPDDGISATAEENTLAATADPNSLSGTVEAGTLTATAQDGPLSVTVESGDLTVIPR